MSRSFIIDKTVEEKINPLTVGIQKPFIFTTNNIITVQKESAYSVVKGG